MLRADLHILFLVAAAVEGEQEKLREVGARAEELHLLADLHRGDAACDGVVVAVDRAHHVVVLILEGVGVAGDLRGKALPVFRQGFAPQHGEVRFGGGVEVVERLQHAEAVLCHERTAVLADAAERLGDPHRIAAEELVVLRGAQVAGHAQLHHEVVHDFLRSGFVENTLAQVALEVNVKEGGNAAEAHCRAVLLLDGGKIAEVSPLHGLAGVLRRTGDVEAVGGGHLLHVGERLQLHGKLLKGADGALEHRLLAAGQLVLLLFLDQAVDAVERHTAVVADDASAPVGVRQAGDEAAVARRADLGRVGGEHTVVVRAVLAELLLHVLGDGIAVRLACVVHHAHAAEGVARAL